MTPEHDGPLGDDALEGEAIMPEGYEPLTTAHASVLARYGPQAAPAEPPPPPAPLPRAWLLAAGASWAVLALLAVNPPPVLQGEVSRPYAPPPGLEEASMRYGLWLGHNAVTRFVAAEHRLPVSLAEAGVHDPALRLQGTGELSWVIQADDERLALRHSESADAFLGESLERLRAAR